MSDGEPVEHEPAEAGVVLRQIVDRPASATARGGQTSAGLQSKSLGQSTLNENSTAESCGSKSVGALASPVAGTQCAACRSRSRPRGARQHCSMRSVNNVSDRTRGTRSDIGRKCTRHAPRRRDAHAAAMRLLTQSRRRRGEEVDEQRPLTRTALVGASRSSDLEEVDAVERRCCQQPTASPPVRCSRNSCSCALVRPGARIRLRGSPACGG